MRRRSARAYANSRPHHRHCICRRERDRRRRRRKRRRQEVRRRSKREIGRRPRRDCCQKTSDELIHTTTLAYLCVQILGTRRRNRWAIAKSPIEEAKRVGVAASPSSGGDGAALRRDR